MAVKKLIQLLTVAAWATFGSALAAESSVRCPNIVFILADDLGYADLSCFGSKAVQTPHLDALAAGGVKLTQFYAASAVCTPTRASIARWSTPPACRACGMSWRARERCTTGFARSPCLSSAAHAPRSPSIGPSSGRSRRVRLRPPAPRCRATSAAISFWRARSPCGIPTTSKRRQRRTPPFHREGRLRARGAVTNPRALTPGGVTPVVVPVGG